MLGMATYDYYMFDDPSNDRLQGILITVISCILLLTYTLLGLLSVLYTQLAKEMKKLFIFIMGISPILAGIKVYILVMLIEDRGDIVTEYILVQTYVTSKIYIVITDLLLVVMLIALGCWMLKYFGKGLKDILEKNSDSFITQRLYKI